VFAAELEGGTRDLTILGYEPGLVDTPMQTAVRSSTPERMPIVQVFKDWASSGALVKPEQPAGRIAEYLVADGHARWTEERFEIVPADSPAS